MYKFGDYCLDTAKSIIKSHHSMGDIFEVIRETRDVELKEKLINFVKGYLDYIDNCIKEANNLLITLPFVSVCMKDVINIKVLESTRDKLIDIKADTESRLKAAQQY